MPPRADSRRRRPHRRVARVPAQRTRGLPACLRRFVTDGWKRSAIEKSYRESRFCNVSPLPMNGALKRIWNLLANLKAAGYQPEQVDEVYITHMHFDHVGGRWPATSSPFPTPWCAPTSTTPTTG